MKDEKILKLLEIKAQMQSSSEFKKLLQSMQAIKGDKGEKGEDGYTPIKGTDYFTASEIRDFKNSILEIIRPAIQASLPEKYEDYFTEQDVQEIVAKVQSLIVMPENGKDAEVDYESIYSYVTDCVVNKLSDLDALVTSKMPTGETLRDMLEDLQEDERLDAKYIKGLEEMNSDTLNRAIEILDQRTQFLINKQTTSTSSGGGTWGSITGTLSDQTDLQAALDAKFTLPSLTSGSVLFSNGTTITQDNANFFWDDANNRLGVGTSSPGSAFEVSGSGAANTNGAIRLRNVVDSYVFALVNGIPAITNSGFSIGDVNAGTSRFTINSSGNVGIGNLTATRQLHIQGLGQATSTGLTDSGNTGGTIYVQDSGFGAYNGGAIILGAFQGFFSAIKSNLRDGTANTIGDLDFQTRNSTSDTSLTSRLFIESTGNIGIGTTSPTVKLDIRGGILGQVVVEASTAGSGSPNILALSESLKLLTNEGATAKAYNTLPTAVAGLTFTFYVQDADGLRITANTGNTIRIAGVVSSTAGYAESTVIGSSVTLIAINNLEWVATSSLGTWTLA